VIRKASQVEIQITRPPTPVVVPPKVDRPPPPKPAAAAARPQPHLSLPEPVHGTSAAEADQPAVDPPHEDVDTAPAGTGTGEAPVVQAPPPPPAPVIQAQVSGNYLTNPRPPYPHLAQREGWEGNILLHVRVLANGRPEAISVLKSSGHAVLDNAAIEAVRGWTFTPSTQGGIAIVGSVNVPFDFHLQ